MKMTFQLKKAMRILLAWQAFDQTTSLSLASFSDMETGTIQRAYAEELRTAGLVVMNEAVYLTPEGRKAAVC